MTAAVDHDLDTLRVELWTLAQQGRHEVDALRAASRVAAVDAALARLVQRGDACIQGIAVRLTAAGRARARRQVRRHRLTEVLAAVIVASEAGEPEIARVIEGTLEAPTIESLCCFLGHAPIGRCAGIATWCDRRTPDGGHEYEILLRATRRLGTARSGRRSA